MTGNHVACRQSFGLYRSGALVGVASYCVSSAQALQLAYPELIPGVEALELGRFVIEDDEPGNVETWLDARCREYLFASGVRAVLSFADPVPRVDARGRVLFVGHVGYIYQAGGYRIAGRSTRRTQWQLPDGMYLNGVTMQISCGAGAGTTPFTWSMVSAHQRHGRPSHWARASAVP